MKFELALGLFITGCMGLIGLADEPKARTTLDNSRIAFQVPAKPYVTVERSDVQVVVVDNRAVNDRKLSGHRAGYSGLASLSHEARSENLFVPAYAGLNFEHIHDGTVQDRRILFEPRNSPMELRVVDKFTCELYQAPTPYWKLESCTRYELLADGTIEMTLECIPRARTFSNNYIGLFWASYIHRPKSLDIHFKGHDGSEPRGTSRWMRGVTPAHGVLATHVSIHDDRNFMHDKAFPLTLVFNRSKYRYAEPWYFGISHGMAFVLMFRPEDKVRLTQSPSGGGRGNPAWDFQFFISNYEVGRRYQLVMRAMYVPFQSVEQIERTTRPHRKALGQ